MCFMLMMKLEQFLEFVAIRFYVLQVNTDDRSWDDSFEKFIRSVSSKSPSRAVTRCSFSAFGLVWTKERII